MAFPLANTKSTTLHDGRLPAARRGMALYLYVLVLALTVSLLGLGSLAIVRVERRVDQHHQELSEAQLNARSGIELALLNIKNDSNWRSNTTHNVESTPVNSLGGTFSSRLLDPLDGNLADDPAETVLVEGIGRVGESIWVEQISVEPIEGPPYGPNILRSFSDSGSGANATINDSSWISQYTVPTLPAGTVYWTVTTVDFYVRNFGANDGTLRVRLYEPNGSNLPQTVKESIDVPESLLPQSGFAWHSVHFSGDAQFQPGDGICIGFESGNSNLAGQVWYKFTGVSESDSNISLGSSGVYQTPRTDSAVWYRLHGKYVMLDNLRIYEGSWTRTVE